MIDRKERQDKVQQHNNDDSTSVIAGKADNDSIDNEQKINNSSTSSYENNNEEWLMKRAKMAFSASAEDENDWLFKRARLSFAASEEVDNENENRSSDPTEVMTKTYIDEVLAEMKKLDRGKDKMKMRHKDTAATTAEAAENKENSMQ